MFAAFAGKYVVSFNFRRNINGFVDTFVAQGDGTVTDSKGKRGTLKMTTDSRCMGTPCAALTGYYPAGQGEPHLWSMEAGAGLLSVEHYNANSKGIVGTTHDLLRLCWGQGAAAGPASPVFKGVQGKFQLLPHAPPYYPIPRVKGPTRSNTRSVTVG